MYALSIAAAAATLLTVFDLYHGAESMIYRRGVWLAGWLAGCLVGWFVVVVVTVPAPFPPRSLLGNFQVS